MFSADLYSITYKLYICVYFVYVEHVVYDSKALRTLTAFRTTFRTALRNTFRRTPFPDILFRRATAERCAGSEDAALAHTDKRHAIRTIHMIYIYI